ncbi:MAG: ABC-2 transporter permease [Eubacteriales bacterium]
MAKICCSKNRIFAFMYQDFYGLRPSFGRFLGVVGLYWILGVVGALSPMLCVVMVEILVMLLPISVFSQDTPSGWVGYVMLLPDGSVGLVAGRYCFGLSFGIVASFVNLLLLLLFRNLFPIFREDALILLLFASFILGILLQSITFPLNFHLGAQRAKPWYFLMAFVIFLPIFLLLEGHSGLFSLPSVTPLPLPILGLSAMFGVSIGADYLSFLFSCALISKKELSDFS